ncbi:FkbM family methyltransferase [Lewinella sp. IMCC34183]|uniref:FkbM family methyltransferase n=1 Tax=Lewinella sp. IMCC34183 TaxID=2248762 RepID=UPI000E287919|nr:FkbM family methyltransferase [Lewinella sp. IMCC34183]
MTETELLQRIRQVSGLAEGSRLRRWLHRPVGYPVALLHRTLLYRRTGRALPRRCRTCWGDRFEVRLPSGTDIYLTGGKTHDSELRLARYLVKTLRRGNSFLDVGAHYGYFSLLAARRFGGGGRVVALEASPTTFATLASNVRPAGVEAWNLAAAETSGGGGSFSSFQIYTPNTIRSIR